MSDSETSSSTAQGGAELDPVDILASRFREALDRAFGSIGADADPMISASRRAEFGDFQSNAAMPLAKALGRPPREVASRIVETLDLGDLAEPVTERSIAGPGFINITLRAAGLSSLLERLDQPALGIAPPSSPETVVVDLCGINLAKQMHVGHLRSMIIGDAIARTLERLGNRVIRQNHVGDWGLPIAMVTRRLADEALAGRIDLDAVGLDDLDWLYREAQREAAPDRRGLDAARRWRMGPKAIAELEEQVAGAEEALERAKSTLIRLQSHDPETVSIWRRIAEVTLRECLSVCARLGVAVTEEHSAGESSYADELAPLVEDLESRGVAQRSEGALVVRVEGLEQPCLVRKGDGGYLYATTDLAGIRRRVQRLGADRVIYCVDARQSLHFELVFGAARAARYATKPGTEQPASLEHAAFGTVLGEDHKPFKTRSGENVKLADLLDEADERASAIVASKNPDLDPVERDAIARAVAVAAIKYADLSTDRVRDYVFSFDRMLAFEGDTGPYLLYAVARIRSIFRRAAERGIGHDPEASIVLDEPAERSLALTLLRWPASVRAVGRTLEPHRLCAHLHDLAEAYSAFNQTCRVLDADRPEVRASRLRLCDLTRRVLEDGLTTLGIEPLDRM